MQNILLIKIFAISLSQKVKAIINLTPTTMSKTIIEIDYKQANGDFTLALANALGIKANRVEVLVTPAKELIPFCCDYRVVNKCADIVAKVDGEILQLNII